MCNAPSTKRLETVRTSGDPRLKKRRRTVGPCPLLDLPPTVLSIITGKLPRQFEFAAALTCRELRTAVADARQLRGEEDGRMRTPVVGLVRSRLVFMKWAIACGAPLSPSLCTAAATRGYVAKLASLRSVGCPWDEETCASTLHMIAKEPLKRIQPLRANGCPWDERTCLAAIIYGHNCDGHFAAFKWAIANGCPYSPTCIGFLTEYAPLDLLDWFVEDRGCNLDQDFLMVAICEGRSDMLKWARAKGYEWQSMASCLLAEGRLGLDALKCAYATGCRLSPHACTHVAKGGNLDALVWLREQGCASKPARGSLRRTSTRGSNTSDLATSRCCASALRAAAQPARECQLSRPAEVCLRR
jgi:hypothetical protein